MYFWEIVFENINSGLVRVIYGHRFFTKKELAQLNGEFYLTNQTIMQFAKGVNLAIWKPISWRILYNVH